MGLHIDVVGDAVSYEGYSPSSKIVAWFKEHDISIDEYVHGDLTDDQLATIPEDCDFWDVDNEEPKDGWEETEFEGGVLLEHGKMTIYENEAEVLKGDLVELTAASRIDKFTVGIEGVLILRKNTLGINYSADIEGDEPFDKDQLDFNVIEDQFGKRIYNMSYGLDDIRSNEDEDEADGCVEILVLTGE